MRSEDDRALLEDMRANIGYAREFIGEKTFEEFAASRLTFYATTRA